MPSLKQSSSQNPLTGAGIIRYFDIEEGIQVDPRAFIAFTIAFVIFEVFLSVFFTAPAAVIAP